MFYDLLLQNENRSENMWMNPRLTTLLLLTPTSLLHTFRNRGTAHVLCSSKNKSRFLFEFKQPKTNHDAKKHHTILNFQKISRCSRPALHTGKIKAKPLDFCSYTILTTSNQEYLTHFPWACSKVSCILGIHVKSNGSCRWDRDVVTALVFMRWIWTPSLSNPNTRKEHCWLSFQTL